MRVLCTGIAGFVCSHIAEKLIARGHDVVGIDDFSGGAIENCPAASKWFEGSVTDASFVNRLFSEDDLRPDAVIHCAAPAAEVFSHHARAFYYDANITGTSRIVNACVNHGVKVLAYTSSIAVYGDGEAPFYEGSTLSPIDPYGISKAAAERDIIAAQRFFGLNHVIFRCHNVIGTRQNSGDALRNVAAIFIRQAIEGKPLTVFGDGSQRRAFSPVSYVADVIAASIERPATWSQTYNLGSDNAISVLELAKVVLHIHGSGEIVHLPARHEAHEAWCDHGKVAAAFSDIKPPPDIMPTLMEMYDEAKTRPPRAMQPLPPVECAKNMPEVWKR